MLKTEKQSISGLIQRLPQVYNESQMLAYDKNTQKREKLNNQIKEFAASNAHAVKRSKLYEKVSLRTKYGDGTPTPYAYKKKKEEEEANRHKKRFNIIFYSLVFLLIALIGAAIGIYYMLFAHKNKNTDHFISNNTDNKHSYILYFITFLIFISAILYLVQNN